MKRVGFTLLLCIGASIMGAQTSKIEQEFRQKLESVSHKNSTISCQFTQTKRVKNIKQPISSRGDFYYDNGGRMALLYKEPQGDKVVMNGEQMTVVTNGRKLTSSAQANPMMAQISYMMKACMSGSIGDLGRGWSMQIEKKDASYRVLLTPVDRRMKRYVSGMIMLFEEVHLTLDQLRIEEATGGFTEYRFVNKRINQRIDDSCFKVE